MTLIDTLAQQHKLFAFLSSLKADLGRLRHTPNWTVTDRRRDIAADAPSPIDYQLLFRGSASSIYAVTRESADNLAWVLNTADLQRFEARIAETEGKIRALLTDAMLGGAE